MKTTTFAVALLGLFPAIMAQAPSPTESVGCEPHGDHWHCEAARTGVEAKATESEHDHSHSAGGSASLAPSPTESVGCEPHGDHCTFLLTTILESHTNYPRALRWSRYRCFRQHSYFQRLSCCHRQRCHRSDDPSGWYGRRCCFRSLNREVENG